MVEVLDPLFLFYFLILPMVVGMGIDSKIRNRYPYGAACGVFSFFVIAIWTHMGISARWGLLEPVMVLMVTGLSILLIGLAYEHKRPVSNFTRHAVVLTAVAFSGLPLYAVFRIMRGEMGFEYPASVLPLFQFTLAVVGLVVLANVLETRLYTRNEAKDSKSIHREEDLLDMRFEDMDEFSIQREFDYPRDVGIPSSRPDAGFIKMDPGSDDLLKK
jgi:hypothetical protein